MTNLKYDVNLDKDLSLQKQAHYYDTVELEEGFDLTQKKRRHTVNKRVHILIPEHLYQTAMKIGTSAGTGYQNTLKMAIMIGLHELEEKTKGPVKRRA